MAGAPVSDEAILLRPIRLGESSIIFSALTRDHGRIKLVARSGRRLGGKFSGILEAGNELEIVHYPRPGNDLWTLSEASLRRAALTGGSSLTKISHLLAALELADRLIPLQQPMGELERVYRSFLDHWHPGGDEIMPGLFFGLEMALLAEMGLSIEMDQCLECGADLRKESRALYRAASGGFCCRSCGQGHGLWEDEQTLQDLFRIRSALDGSEIPLLDRSRRRSVGKLLHEHMTFHLSSYKLPRALFWLAGGRSKD